MLSAFFTNFHLTQTFTVNKRYSEFERLCRDLAREDETVFLPPLPEKNRNANAAAPKKETISARKAGLERFLNKALTHARLRASRALRKFVSQVSPSLTAAGLCGQGRRTRVDF